MLIAYYFGAKLEVDIFYFAYNIVIWGYGIVQTLTSSVLVPISMHIRVKEGNRSSQEYFNIFIYIILILSVIAACLIQWRPQGLFSLISEFKPSAIEENIGIIRLAFFTFLFFGLNAVFSEILISYRHFATPIIATIVNNVLLIIFIVFFHRSLAVKGVAMGLIIGYGINFCILFYLFVIKLRWHFGGIRFLYFKQTLHKISYTFISALSTAFAAYFPFYLLSRLQEGVITTVNYAAKAVEAPSMIIMSQFLVVMGIRLNELYSRKEEGKCANFYNKISIRFLLFFSLIVFILYFLSNPILSILYYRGQITAEDIQGISQLFKVLILSMPFLAYIYMGFKVFYSAQRVKEVTYFILSMNVVLITSSYFSIRYFGYMGFAYGQFVAYLFSAFLMLLFMQKMFPGFSKKNIIPLCSIAFIFICLLCI